MRTDQTSLCVPCRLRFAAGERCPRCDQPSIDLRRAADREGARGALLVTPRRVPRMARWLIPSPGCLLAVVLTLIVVATFAGMFFFGSHAGGWGLICASFAVPTLSTLIWTLVLGRLYDRWMTRVAEARGDLRSDALAIDPAAAAPPRIALRRPDPESAPGRIVVDGSVKIRTAVVSPVAGRECAAFRVSGTAGLDEIDDAQLGAFDVIRDDGEVVRVESQAGAIDLELPAPSPVAWSQRLERFLEPRVLAAAGDLRLSEAVLSEGDRVRVEGSLEERARADGYRGAKAERVLSDRPGSPLVVRR